MNNLTLSERAAKRITAVLASEPEGSALRIGVHGGGCSGFQYDFKIDQARHPDDIVIERDGAVVLVDEISLQYMDGSVIDFVDDLMGQSFRIQNPNAQASCGCGVSFSL